jgi:methyltransferase (TIGR00027 family)
MAEAVQRGIRQCVVLGAGLDTFAYRQPDWARGLTIYEVDHPESQADKRRRLQAAGIEAPGNVRYAAIDFETTSLHDGLEAAGVDFTLATFFSCLGVFVYLTREAVEAVFELVASFPKGSEIAFTFASTLSGAIAERARDAGEPWQTTFARDEIGALLKGIGFATVDFLEAGQIRRYFGHRTDALPVPKSSSIAAARVG